ncbi:hypothetical protein SteCoe_1054 [Stentor coeruleus]|uniref:IgGFc-binding protein N-terminal domain-containing protein n=1 Tax=Stentor coeruleus TaxID=5963 RepID=A0A1R2D2H3_9CILI|nr:hypothetical protein SteCoe_1054 [Stentor coeruleus]
MVLIFLVIFTGFCQDFLEINQEIQITESYVFQIRPTNYEYIILTSDFEDTSFYIKEGKIPTIYKFDHSCGNLCIIENDYHANSTIFLLIEGNGLFKISLSGTNSENAEQGKYMIGTLDKNQVKIYTYTPKSPVKGQALLKYPANSSATFFVSIDQLKSPKKLKSKNWSFGDFQTFTSSSIQAVFIFIQCKQTLDYTLIIDIGEPLAISSDVIFGQTLFNETTKYSYSIIPEEKYSLKLALFSGICEVYLNQQKITQVDEIDTFLSHPLNFFYSFTSISSIITISISCNKTSSYTLSLIRNLYQNSFLELGIPYIGNLNTSQSDYYLIPNFSEEIATIQIMSFIGLAKISLYECYENCILSESLDEVYSRTQDYSITEINIPVRNKIFGYLLEISRVLDMMMIYEVSVFTKSTVQLVRVSVPVIRTSEIYSVTKFRITSNENLNRNIYSKITTIFGSVENYIFHDSYESSGLFNAFKTSYSYFTNSITSFDYLHLLIHEFSYEFSMFHVVIDFSRNSGLLYEILIPGIKSFRDLLHGDPTSSVILNFYIPAKDYIIDSYVEFFKEVGNFQVFLIDTRNTEKILLELDNGKFYIKDIVVNKSPGSIVSIMVEGTEFYDNAIARFYAVYRIKSNKNLLANKDHQIVYESNNLKSDYVILIGKHHPTIKLSIAGNTSPATICGSFSKFKCDFSESFFELSPTSYLNNCPMLETALPFSTDFCELFITINSSEDIEIIYHEIYPTIYSMNIDYQYYKIIPQGSISIDTALIAPFDYKFNIHSVLGHGKISFNFTKYVGFFEREFYEKIEDYSIVEEIISGTWKGINLLYYNYYDYMIDYEYILSLYVLLECLSPRCVFFYEIKPTNHIMITPGKSYKGSTYKENKKYYSFYHTSKNEKIIIHLESNFGDADLGVNKVEYNQVGSYMWNTYTYNYDILIIYPDDPYFITDNISGEYLIAVHSSNWAIYTLKICSGDCGTYDISYNQPIDFLVNENSYKYYVYNHQVFSSFTIDVIPSSGNITFFISTSQIDDSYNVFPDFTTNKWSAANDSIITITTKDKNFCYMCAYVIAVYGFENSSCIISINHIYDYKILSPGKVELGKVDQGKWLFYSFYANKNSFVYFSLTSYSGNADLFINTQEIVNFDTAKWRNLQTEKINSLTIYPEEFEFDEGNFFIGVYGIADTEQGLFAYQKDDIIDLTLDNEICFNINSDRKIVFKSENHYKMYSALTCKIEMLNTDSFPDILLGYSYNNEIPSEELFESKYSIINSTDKKSLQITQTLPLLSYAYIKIISKIESAICIKCTISTTFYEIKQNDVILVVIPKNSQLISYKIKAINNDIMSIITKDCGFEYSFVIFPERNTFEIINYEIYNFEKYAVILNPIGVYWINIISQQYEEISIAMTVLQAKNATDTLIEPLYKINHAEFYKETYFVFWDPLVEQKGLLQKPLYNIFLTKKILEENSLCLLNNNIMRNTEKFSTNGSYIQVQTTKKYKFVYVVAEINTSLEVKTYALYNYGVIEFIESYYYVYVILATISAVVIFVGIYLGFKILKRKLHPVNEIELIQMNDFSKNIKKNSLNKS